MKKRTKKYEKGIDLKDHVQFEDLIKASLQTPKKVEPKAKRAKGKKK